MLKPHLVTLRRENGAHKHYSVTEGGSSLICTADYMKKFFPWDIDKILIVVHTPGQTLNKNVNDFE